MTYSVTEPHPSVRPNRYMHTGRGGAGNSFKAPATSEGNTASGPASLFTQGLPKQSSSTAKFSSGRGGAGNIHLSSEKAPFSFDEELERQSTRARKEKDGALWHVGRGGAGNWANTVSSSSNASSSRKDSMSSQGSNVSGFFETQPYF